MTPTITLSVDDVHPGKGWRILGDKTEKWFRTLNEDYGLRFTLFVPSNYHGEYPLTEHKEWVKEMLAVPYFELAAHGHYHDSSDAERWGECEFGEIASKSACDERLKMLFGEWDAVGHRPVGWRSPGWLAHPNCIDSIGNSFEYVALHKHHNYHHQWPTTMIFGHDGIDMDSVNMDSYGRVMLQSHIAGDWNDNAWNEDNYDNVRGWMDYLRSNPEANWQFKTLGELQAVNV